MIIGKDVEVVKIYVFTISCSTDIKGVMIKNYNHMLGNKKRTKLKL